MRSIASRMTVMSGEGALSVFARAKELEAQGHSIIHLELGEPDFHPGPSVIESANRALCQLTGYTEDDIVGGSVLAFVHPEDMEALVLRLEALARDKKRAGSGVRFVLLPSLGKTVTRAMQLDEILAGLTELSGATRSG